MLLDRALGGAATLILAAVGLVLAVGRLRRRRLPLARARARRRDGRRRRRRLLAAGAAARSRACGRCSAWLRLERPLRAVYEGIHTYRTHAGLLVGLLAFTVVAAGVPGARRSGWSGSRSAIDLSPRPYYVMGPMLFVVLLAPFTINGLAVREAFFVSFLGNLGVERRPGLRGRLPLLPGHARCSRCPGR